MVRPLQVLEWKHNIVSNLLMGFFGKCFGNVIQSASIKHPINMINISYSLRISRCIIVYMISLHIFYILDILDRKLKKKIPQKVHISNIFTLFIFIYKYYA